jgi:pimeloyl-ACP methyl ester carboxylesterase
MSQSQSNAIFSATYDPPEHLWLAVHFAPSEASRAAGLKFIERKLRRKDRDPEVSPQTVAAQSEAIGKYIIPSAESDPGVLDYLKAMTLPVLIVQGSNDVTIPTRHSVTLQQSLPNAQLIVYPDSNHGSFYQYPDPFVAHATLFLNA